MISCLLPVSFFLPAEWRYLPEWLCSFLPQKVICCCQETQLQKSDLWRIKGIRLHRNNYYQDPNWVISGLKFSLKQLPIPSSWKNKTQVNSSLSSPADGRKRFFLCVGEVLLMRQKTNSWRKKKTWHTSTQSIGRFFSIIKSFFVIEGSKQFKSPIIFLYQGLQMIGNFFFKFYNLLLVCCESWDLQFQAA